MRVRIAMMALSGMALVAAGCGSDTTSSTGTGEITKKDLKILSLTPATVYIEGQDSVTMKTENGCGKANATLKVGDIPVTTFDATDNNTYVFTAPAKEVTGTAPVPVVVKLECSKAPDTTFTYGKNSAEGTLTYDPQSEPPPLIKTASPQGGEIHANGISVLAQMVVVFTRPINPDTVTKDSFGISGITGTIIKDDPKNETFKFKPDAQLNYATQYTAFVTTAVKSAKAGKALVPSLPGKTNDKDQWTFTTRCEGCGNPWLGDISAAAGISSGGSYKLFSVTGQPTPVGEASNEQYKLQSGFIYATAPGTTP